MPTQKTAKRNRSIVEQNRALVLIKPHAANSDACEALCIAHLKTAGCTIKSSRRFSGAEISKQTLIDRHYGSLAAAAMTTEPDSIFLSVENLIEFQRQFGLPWEQARKLTNPQALQEMGCDGQALEVMWRAGPCVKLAPGIYVAELLSKPSSTPRTFTINGFYPGMRQQFVAEDACVRVFEVSWDSNKMAWSAFKEDVIGSTDPATAAAGSLRAQLRGDWKQVDLDAEPSIANNCVHASAGPLEGLKERMVWTMDSMEGDAFGSSLAEVVGREQLLGILDTNPVLELGGKKGKAFDVTEGMNASDVIDAFAEQAAPTSPRLSSSSIGAFMPTEYSL